MRFGDRRGVRRGVALLTTTVVALTGVCACAAPDPELSSAVREVRMTSAGGQAELVLLPPGEPQKVMVFMHGFDSDQQQLVTTSGLFPVRDALLAAGFALASSNAHGDNVGNPASLEDQVDLIADVGTLLPGLQEVDVMGFSMGGLDALLAASTAPTAVHAVVLLSPVTDQRAFVDSRYESAIASAFRSSKSDDLVEATAASNPSEKPADSYRGPRYQFWHSTADTVVPVQQSLAMVDLLKGAGVDATFTALDGDHGDLAALDPSAVVHFLEQP